MPRPEPNFVTFEIDGREVEGIPKLQTACSTPIRDGMVVYTTSDHVKNAQNAVV